MNPESTLKQMLKENGATLKRSKRHLIYELPNGQNFVLAKTPSDIASAANSVSDLRAALGLKRPSKHPRVRVRRHKNRNRSGGYVPQEPFNTTIQDQLRKIGVVEDKLREERDAAVSQAGNLLIENRRVNSFLGHALKQLTETREALDTANRELASRPEPTCWWCKLKAQFSTFFS